MLKKNPNFLRFIRLNDVRPMDKEKYKQSIQKQRRDRTVRMVCSNCGEDDPTVIEMHHIYGRNNSEETTPLCQNCHTKITQDQNKISPSLRSKNASPNEKQGFLLVTVGSLLELVGKTLKNLGHEVILHG